MLHGVHAGEDQPIVGSGIHFGGLRLGTKLDDRNLDWRCPEFSQAFREFPRLIARSRHNDALSGQGQAFAPVQDISQCHDLSDDQRSRR